MLGIWVSQCRTQEYFESKGYAISFRWDDMLNEAHAKAFTVAGAMKLDLLAAIRGELDSALKEGKTFQSFKKEMVPVLKKNGFWGEVEVTDPQTGEIRTTNVTPWRLRTIYRTNMQSAYMAGRYQAQAEDDNRPYLQYVALMDAKTRDSHAAMNGTVLHKDDTWWEENYPPNGWGCRCRVRARSKRDIDRLGLKVHDGEKLKGVAQKGFQSNPGKAAWQPDLEKYNYDESRKYLEAAMNGPAFKRFYEEKLGGDVPVAVLNESLRKLLKAKVNTIKLSQATLAKNKKHHPELTINQYRQLPDVIENAQLIVKDTDRTLVFYRAGEDILYAAVKTTRSGNENFLTSFRKASSQLVANIKRRGEVIKDEL